MSAKCQWHNPGSRVCWSPQPGLQQPLHLEAWDLLPATGGKERNFSRSSRSWPWTTVQPRDTMHHDQSMLFLARHLHLDLLGVFETKGLGDARGCAMVYGRNICQTPSLLPAQSCSTLFSFLPPFQATFLLLNRQILVPPPLCSFHSPAYRYSSFGVTVLTHSCTCRQSSSYQ